MVEAILLGYFIVAVLTLVATLWVAHDTGEAGSTRYLFASLLWALLWPLTWFLVIVLVRRNGGR